jgi:hypothetical protein
VNLIDYISANISSTDGVLVSRAGNSVTLLREGQPAKETNENPSPYSIEIWHCLRGQSKATKLASALRARTSLSITDASSLLSI